MLYPNVAALNFANAQSYFDTATSTMQLGAPLYQGAVRIGTSTTYGDLTRAAGGALLWDGAAMASESLVATKQDQLAHLHEITSPAPSQTIINSAVTFSTAAVTGSPPPFTIFDTGTSSLMGIR